MPENIKDNESPDQDKKEETVDEAPSGEEGNGPDKEGPDEPVKNRGIKKWILIIIAGIIVVSSGLGYLFMPERFHSLFKKEFNGPGIIDEGNLTEENISPFFVPPEKADNKAIRIDLTIIWDGIASIKYKKNELSARQMMSERFNKRARQHPDLNAVKSDLENEIGSMLRSSLGVQNLDIRIKEIRYF